MRSRSTCCAVTPRCVFFAAENCPFLEYQIHTIFLSVQAKEIKLSNQKLGPADAMVISAMLKYNTSVQELQLGYNSFGTPGAVSIADGIKHCRSITKLFMHNNKVRVRARRGLPNLAVAPRPSVGCCVVPYAR